MIGAAVGLAPHVGDREAEIDQVMVGERQRRVVERLQQRAGDQMRLAWPPWRDQACSVSWCSSPARVPVEKSAMRASPSVT